MLLQKIDNSWGIGPAASTIAAVSLQNFNILRQASRIRGITLLQGTASVVLALLFSLVGIGFVVWQMRRVLREDQGNQTMREIAGAVQVGASAFLRREYTYLTAFVVIVTLVIAAFLNWQTALAFVIGAVISAATGYLGMYVAVRSNVRTAAAAVRSLNDGLRVAFASGSVMGMAVVSFGLLGLSLVYLLYSGDIQNDITYIAGFGFGASSIALFARVGGGIYTKAADVGADLVGKVEAGIPEDDARNPAVIADNVGDNVGDVAGMGADLFESYVGSIIAAASLGVVMTSASASLYAYVGLPFLIAAGGIIASLIGSFLVKTKEDATQEDLLGTLRRSVWASSGIVLVLAALLVLLSGVSFNYFWAILVGLIAGNAIAYFTEYYTSYTNKPTQSIADAAETGAATIMIQGIAVGMNSTAAPVLVVAIGILLALWFGITGDPDMGITGGLYAVALAGVGMLSTLGVTLATDAYGPVADNAGGIAEMSSLPPYVRERTDALDSLGNTTAATGKGFAIGSAVLTALALIGAYMQAAGMTTLDMLRPTVLPGLLIGAMLPFLFSALTMMAVGRAAKEIVLEVRRQFQEIAGLMEGTAQPDYARCVDISTRSALREMILPGVLAVASPLLVGFILGKEALAGMLIGATSAGFLLAVMMANAGGAWDNAKKYIEAGEMGGKGSAAHKAAVVGDTVGDPFKDTSGPSLNILIKLMSIVALVFAAAFGAGLLTF
jgi:K(+)-stimulated pyrophosphate-energized sodium pump